MGKKTENLRTQSKLHALPMRKIGLAWLGEAVAVDARETKTSYWHTHERQLEIIYCLHGEMSYEFRDRPAITLPGGTAIVIPPKSEHRIRSGLDTPCRRISLLVNTTLPRERAFVVFSRGEFARLYRAVADKAYHPIPFSRTAAAQLDFLWSVATASQPSSAPLLPSKLRLAVCHLILESATGDPPKEVPKHPRLFDEAVAWLEAHLGETIRIPQLVAYIGYSRARFFDLFRQHTGLTPADYLKRLRIRKAQELLRAHPDRSVASVAREVGFRDPSHFSATFRRFTGVSPNRRACS